MPSKNLIRRYGADCYYHVYNRGAAKQLVFREVDDKSYFMYLLRRHLDPTFDAKDKHEKPYRKFDVELIAYCIMNNHFHLLLRNGEDKTAIPELMRAVMIAYSYYFNHKYKASGAVFQGKYKASLIDSEPYLLHITRYIHINPRTYRTYRWSSLREYIGQRQTSWVRHDRLLTMSPVQYLEFVEDWEDRKAESKTLKEQIDSW